MVKILTVQGNFCGAGIQKNRLRLAQPEGIVIRPKTPVFSKRLSGNLSMKVINNRYLLKNED